MAILPNKEHSGYFKNVQVPVKWDRLSEANCMGAFYTSYGEISYFDLKSSRGAFSPTVLQILRPDTITWVNVTGPRYVWPHRDLKISVALNFYVNTAQTDTYFYDPIDPSSISADPEYNNGLIHQFEDVSFVDYFVAKDREVYLLNVHKIHALRVRGEKREFLQMSWYSTSFNEVLQRISKIAAPLSHTSELDQPSAP